MQHVQSCEEILNICDNFHDDGFLITAAQIA